MSTIIEKPQGRLIIDDSKCRGCLSCQLACSFTRHHVFSPKKSCIRIEREVESETTFPKILSKCCDLCGGHPACAEICPYGTITFEEANREK